VHARERLRDREAIPAAQTPAALDADADRNDRAPGQARGRDQPGLRLPARPARAVGCDRGALAAAQRRDEPARRPERSLRGRAADRLVAEVLRDPRIRAMRSPSRLAEIITWMRRRR
jgi:hypothetical protein